MRNLTAVALLFVVGLLTTGRLSFAEDKPLVEKAIVTVQVGDAAPTFKGTDDRGQAWDSAEHVGKNYTVIYFYPADFTGGCIKQAETFRDTMNQLTEQGVTVIGVSGDVVKSHQLFKESWSLNYTLLADEEGDIAKTFGVPVSKGGKVVAYGPDRKRLLNDQQESVFIERKATFARWTFLIGPNGKVLYKNTKVVPATDAKQVLEFIQQDKASNEISTRGGKLEFEEQNSIRWVVSVDLPGCRFKDEDTLLLASLPRVRTVLLGGNVKDSGLVFVTALRNLESLTIDSPHIKGSGLANLASLPKLRSLNVEGTNIKDDSLAHLKECQSLKELNIGSTLVTPRGLKQIAEMTNLESLNVDYLDGPLTDADAQQLTALSKLKSLVVSSSKLTDTGLASLKTLANLETLDVTSTDVTDEGVADFQKALPKVTVIR